MHCPYFSAFRCKLHLRFCAISSAEDSSSMSYSGPSGILSNRCGVESGDCWVDTIKWINWCRRTNLYVKLHYSPMVIWTGALIGRFLLDLKSLRTTVGVLSESAIGLKKKFRYKIKNPMETCRYSNEVNMDKDIPLCKKKHLHWIRYAFPFRLYCYIDHTQPYPCLVWL